MIFDKNNPNKGKKFLDFCKKSDKFFLDIADYVVLEYKKKDKSGEIRSKYKFKKKSEAKNLKVLKDMIIPEDILNNDDENNG